MRESVMGRRAGSACEQVRHDESANSQSGVQGVVPFSLYENLVPPYLNFVRQHRGRRTTHQLENGLRRFFSWLRGFGISDVGQLSAGHIRAFVSSLHHFKRSTIAVHASALRGFLSYLRLQGALTTDLVHAVEVPRVYQMSSPPQVVDEATVERLIAGVDRSTALGKRDYAILLLAARLGVRSSDIRALRFENIHWREQRLVFVQSKTQRSIELPLLADVDEALVEYVRGGRPACSAREVFLRHVAPIGPLARRNHLWTVMGRAVRAAGITLPGPGRGLHLLRHCLATQMLQKGVPFDTISDVLGHMSVDTTRRYAQVDLTGLRSVALSEAEVRG